MGEFNPDYMTDCLECGSQMWHLETFTKDRIRVECGECGVAYSFMRNEAMGADCIDCGGDSWNVKEHLEDEHIMLECENCGVITEVWLHGDELDAQDDSNG